MSYPLHALARLLAPTESQLGRVIARNGDIVRVATARGAVTAQAADGIAIGDRVRITAGRAVRCPAATMKCPV